VPEPDAKLVDPFAGQGRDARVAALQASGRHAAAARRRN
jgi:hypothetical protein